MTSMLEQTWRLSPAVALRPEPFGALAYHFGNRRLTFLKRPDLVEVVRGLDDAPDVREALERSAIPKSQWPAYVEALSRLADADMIRRAGSPTSEGES